ncbi:MAG: diacylglycerol kinase family protein [Bryobacteraceae bacterium]
MAYRNAFLIYNPVAGRVSRSGGRLLQRSIDALHAAGIRVNPAPTTGPGTATEIAVRCLEEDADLILALGGDGTINEVVNGMAGSQVPLGVLPGGTANVLAMELRLGGDAVRVADKLTSNVPVRIATGFMTGSSDHAARHFLTMAGIGLDAYVINHLNLDWKASVGKAAYWIAGFSQVGKKLAEFDVIAGGRTIRAGFAVCSRVRNYGGDLEIARTANLLDDSFELVAFEGDSVSRYLGYFYGVLAGTLKKMKGVTVMHVQKAEFANPAEKGVYAQLDGERMGRLPLTVEIVPNSLTLLMPERFVEQARKQRRVVTESVLTP